MSGAPRGNKYAKKTNPGRTLGVYLTGADFQTLVEMCETQGIAASNREVDALARGLLKDAIAVERRRLVRKRKASLEHVEA